MGLKGSNFKYEHLAKPLGEGGIRTVIQKTKNQIYTRMEGSILLLQVKNMSAIKQKGPSKGPNSV